ncbi:MAG: hypothetical protein ACYCUD_00435 [Candidatus Dormibacteria bacterium]
MTTGTSDMVAERAPRSRPPTWVAGVRIAFGAVLIVDAVLEYQTGTYQVFGGLLYANAAVSPEPLRALLVFAAQLIGQQPAIWNGVLAAVELAMGLGILLGLWARVLLATCLPFFLVIWIFGQGLGLPFAPGTTDLNSGPVYLLLALTLLLGHSWERWSLFAWIRPHGAVTSRRLVAAGAGSVTVAVVLAALTWGSVVSVERRPGQSGPPAVGGAAMALDTQTGEDVLFGGCNALVCSNATWLWNGRRWAAESGTTAPPQSAYAGTAYSPQRHAVVMFGGSTKQGFGPALDTTWSWSRGWRRLSLPNPPAGRRFPALAYDPATRQLLMFGGDGASGKPLAGTFVLGSTGWHQLAVAHQPPPRTAAAMAWDPGLKELILYGGSDGTSRLSDTWAWNGHDWTRLRSPKSPGPLAYVAMSTDPTDGGVLLYAGAGSARRTWKWGRGGWTPIGGSGPTPPVYSFMAMAPAPGGRGVLLVGGATSSGSGFTDQSWLWDGRRWTRLS